MSDFGMAMIIVLVLLGAYCFVRSIFGLGHKATIITMIGSAIMAFFALGQDNRNKRD